MGLAGMTKSVIAMNEIKKAGIPTFAQDRQAVDLLEEHMQVVIFNMIL